MLSELDIKCLWAIADDYEDIALIKKMLNSRFENQLTSSEIALSLLKLVSSELATAHRFDEQNQANEVEYTFEQAQEPHSKTVWKPGKPGSDRLWFLITPIGFEHLKSQPWVFPQD